MADHDKVRIKPLDASSDYSLWRIRVLAAISAKGLDCVFGKKKKNCTPTSEDSSTSSEGAQPRRTEYVKPTEEQCLQASNIIVSALGDHALRVVRSVIGDPSKMMVKLNDRYDSKTTASRISKMSELVSIRYTSLRDSIEKHIDRMAGLIETLRSMGSTFDDALAIGILVASIDVQELLPVVAAIKTLSDRDMKWESVTSRLIEESSDASSSAVINHANTANSSCGICGKSNHSTAKCFINPLNPNNRLNLTEEGKESIRRHGENSNSGSEEEDETPHESTGKERKKKKKVRAAMAREVGESSSSRTSSRMVLDSACTSHLTATSEKVRRSKSTNITIKLADDSSLKSTQKGTRTVRWKTGGGTQRVSLSDTLVVPGLSQDLLSIPSLVSKNIGVLFLPGKAVLVDLKDEYSILGYGSQDEDGLFYISDKQTEIPTTSKQEKREIKACMAIVQQEVDNEAMVDCTSSLRSSECFTDEEDINKDSSEINIEESTATAIPNDATLPVQNAFSTLTTFQSIDLDRSEATIEGSMDVPTQPCQFRTMTEISNEVVDQTELQSTSNVHPNPINYYANDSILRSLETISSDESSTKDAFRSRWIDVGASCEGEGLYELTRNKTWTAKERPPVSVNIHLSMMIPRLQRDQEEVLIGFSRRFDATVTHKRESGVQPTMYEPVENILPVKDQIGKSNGWPIHDSTLEGASGDAYLKSKASMRSYGHPSIPLHFYFSSRYELSDQYHGHRYQLLSRINLLLSELPIIRVACVTYQAILLCTADEFIEKLVYRSWLTINITNLEYSSVQLNTIIVHHETSVSSSQVLMYGKDFNKHFISNGRSIVKFGYPVNLKSTIPFLCLAGNHIVFRGHVVILGHILAVVNGLGVPQITTVRNLEICRICVSRVLLSSRCDPSKAPRCFCIATVAYTYASQKGFFYDDVVAEISSFYTEKLTLLWQKQPFWPFVMTQERSLSRYMYVQEHQALRMLFNLARSCFIPF